MFSFYHSVIDIIGMDAICSPDCDQQISHNQAVNFSGSWLWIFPQLERQSTITFIFNVCFIRPQTLSENDEAISEEIEGTPSAKRNSIIIVRLPSLAFIPDMSSGVTGSVHYVVWKILRLPATTLSRASSYDKCLGIHFCAFVPTTVPAELGHLSLQSGQSEGYQSLHL